MDLRVLVPADEPAVEAFLRPRIASSMFLLGNMRAAGLIDTGERLCGTYVGAFEGGALVGIVAHFWNGILMPQAPVQLEALWRAAVAASRRPVRGAIGPDDQVSAIQAGLRTDAAALERALDVQIDHSEKLYRLDLAELSVPDALRSGAVVGRLAEPRDLDVLTAWRVAFEIEGLGAEDSPQRRADARAAVSRLIGSGDMWVLEAGGRPVATSGFNTRFVEAVQVGGVFTPRDLRGRGYGRCAVAASLLAARADGARLGVLFTGDDNLPAQRAYSALGFSHIGAFRLVLLRQPWQ